VQDQITGLVVESKNPKCLSEALLALALSPEQRKLYGTAGKKRVYENFTLNQCVEQYENFYKQLKK